MLILPAHLPAKLTGNSCHSYWVNYTLDQPHLTQCPTHLFAPKSKVTRGNQATFPVVDWILGGVPEANALSRSEVCPDSAVPSLW